MTFLSRGSSRHGAAEDRGVEFAVDQHLGDVFAGGGALDAGRIAVLGDMGVLERHPFHLAEVEAVILPENAADPDARGLRERAHADPAAGQVLRPHDAAFGIVQHRAMLEAPHHSRRHEHERLAVGLGLQIGDDRHLADVELLLARHQEEGAVDRIDLGEAKRHPIGFDMAVLQRLGVRIASEADAQSLVIFSAVVALIPVSLAGSALIL